MKWAEGFARPDIQTAFFRKARRKLVDYQRAGDEEEDRSQHPQTDGRSAVVARGRDPARAEDRGDVEQQHIPESHGFAQLRFGIDGGWCWNHEEVTEGSFRTQPAWES